MNAYRKITRIALIITASWLMLVLYIALSKMTGPLSDIVLIGLFIWLTLMFLAAWLSMSIAAIMDRNSLALILIGISSIASGLLSIEYWDAMTSGADPRWLAINIYTQDESPPRGYAQELMGSNFSSRCIIDLPDGSIIISDDNGDGLADTKTEQRGLDIYHSTIETIITTNSATKANPAM